MHLPQDLKLLEDKANKIRKDILNVCVPNGAGHIAPSLSTVDLLVALYYKVMRPDDKLIFSKGHGCYALYSILADLGKIEEDEWKLFYKDSFLSGCVERSPLHGLEASCGSLGHGLPMAVGLAYGFKLQGKLERVYCVLGDGEMQEGSNWEALDFASRMNLDNLTLIVDANGLMAMDFLEENNHIILTLKLSSFGFSSDLIDGHKMEDILDKLYKHQKGPYALIAKTIKGYGVKCMENVPKFHFRLPTEEELKQ